MSFKRQWRAWTRRCWRGLVFSGVLALSTSASLAQDAFEIHVLEYEQLQPGEFTFENHTNYVQKGATAALQHTLHVTHELTAGVAEGLSLGVMQLNARRPGTSLESAGWRFVPHFYAPESWHLPVNIGLVVEVTFQNTKWEPNSRTIELVPILEKRFPLSGHREVQIDLNPAVGRVLHGPDVHRGWDFELAGRAALASGYRFTPSVEYYSNWGRVTSFSLLREQTHEILPGFDVRLSKRVLWSFGVGAGLTPATNRIAYKSRVEVSFGAPAKR